MSLKRWLSFWSYVTVSVPAFEFYDPVEGVVKTYNRVHVHPNGHINFHDYTQQYVGDYATLDGHFSSNKGAGINGLLAGMAIDRCGTPSGDCGDVLIWGGVVTDANGNSMVKTVVSFVDVPILDPAVDGQDARNSFQIILHNDGSGTFEIAYGKVSSLAQGGASYGLSLGGDEIPQNLTNPRYSPSCS